MQCFEEPTVFFTIKTVMLRIIDYYTLLLLMCSSRIARCNIMLLELAEVYAYTILNAVGS